MPRKVARIIHSHPSKCRTHCAEFALSKQIVRCSNHSEVPLPQDQQTGPTDSTCSQKQPLESPKTIEPTLHAARFVVAVAKAPFWQSSFQPPFVPPGDVVSDAGPSPSHHTQHPMHLAAHRQDILRSKCIH